MATITEDYVSFEIAKLLKEKGFQAKCTACYHSDPSHTFELVSGRINYCNPRFSKCKMIPPYNAPTLQMAMKWLRIEHNIDIIAPPQYDGIKWTYSAIIFKLSIPCTEIRLNDNKDKKEEAVEIAIKYSLENLI